MPRWTRSCGSSRVMSPPSSRIWPAVGLSTPVSRLTIVVLPAPFGPISAWRAPFSIDSDTWLAATMPPKCLSRPRVSSTTGMTRPRLSAKLRPGAHAPNARDRPLLRQSDPFRDRLADDAERQQRRGGEDEACPRVELEPDRDGDDQPGEDAAIDPAEQHHHDQHEDDPVLPVARRQVGQVVLREAVDQRPDQAAVEIAGAADDQDQQHVGGTLDREHLERREG